MQFVTANTLFFNILMQCVCFGWQHNPLIHGASPSPHCAASNYFYQKIFCKVVWNIKGNAVNI